MTNQKGIDGAKGSEECSRKNFGDAHRVPMVALHCLTALSASCSSLLSFWLPWIYSPFSIFHGIVCNDLQLQLVDV
jgi:hypothetical protein